MATTDQPTLDPSQYSPDDPPKATVDQAHRFPTGTQPSVGHVYEGRVNNVTNAGAVFVSFDEPRDNTDVVGRLPEANTLRSNYLVGDEVYTLVADTDDKYPELLEVEVVGSEDRTSAHAETQAQFDTLADDASDADADTAGETKPDTTAENETVPVAAYGCHLCPDDDRYTDSSPEAVRQHITDGDDYRHKGHHGSDPAESILTLNSDGEVVNTETLAEASSGDTGDESVTLVSDTMWDTKTDKVIIETAVRYPGISLKDIRERVRETEGAADRISNRHIRWLLADLPWVGDSRGASDPCPEAARENIAKLYYYYGLSQTDIGTRYGWQQGDVSKLMTSLDIAPGGQTRENVEVVLSWFTDDLDYGWAADLDSRGEGAPDDDDDRAVTMAQDDDIVPPTTDADDSPTETTPTTEPEPESESSDTTDDDAAETDGETTTRTVGNASYTGPSEGVNVSTQTFAERPVKGGATADDDTETAGGKWNGLTIPPWIRRLAAERFPSGADHPWDSIDDGDLATVEDMRRLLAVVADHYDTHGEWPGRTEILSHDAMPNGDKWVRVHLKGLRAVGLVEDGGYRNQFKTFAIPDDVRPSSETADASDDAATARDDGPTAAEEQAAQNLFDDIVDDHEARPEPTPRAGEGHSYVTDADVERLSAMADRLSRDASSAGSGMAQYAKGIQFALDELGLTGDDR